MKNCDHNKNHQFCGKYCIFICQCCKKKDDVAELLKKMESRHILLSFAVAVFLGIFVVFVELPCTGAPYLVVLGLLTAGNYSDGIPLLLLFVLIFILPLFVIVGLVYFGKTSRAMEKWRNKHKGLMRLGIGLFLIALGAYMLWTVV